MVYIWVPWYFTVLDAKTGFTVSASSLEVQPSSLVGDDYMYATADATAGYDFFVFRSNGTLIYETFDFTTPSFGPAAIGNGNIYVGASNGNSTFDLLAISAATFQLVWQDSILAGSPAVANGVVYAGGDSNLYALNATTGALLWQYTTDGAIDSSAAVAQGAVYIGDRAGNLYALNAETGALIWKTASVGSVSAPAVANGVVYAAAFSNCSIYALSAATGTVLWQYAANCKQGVNPPVVVNGVLYFSSDTSLYAFGLPK
jgi:outer membrane protein assembly factor BamB